MRRIFGFILFLISFSALGANYTLWSPGGDLDPSTSTWNSQTITNSAVTNAKIANGTIDLTAKVTGILPGANGGTANGFFAVSGPTTSLKTFTFPNASATVLTTNAVVTAAQGGTGVANSNTITLGGNVSTAAAFTTSGANSLTLTTTGSTNVTLPTTGILSTTSGANPSASAGLSAVNGSATTFMRSDGAPAISQSIAPTWTGVHTFSPSSNQTKFNGLPDLFAAQITGAASGSSRGLRVSAGAAASDYPFDVTNLAGTDLLYITGIGTVFIPGAASSGAAQTGYWCYDGIQQLIRDTVACIVSARRFKEQIAPLDIGLQQVMQMQPVKFHYKPEFNGKLQSDPNFSGEQVGLIADDVQQIDPRLVTVEKDGKLVHSVRYENMVAVLVKAIQEQQAGINSLRLHVWFLWGVVAFLGYRSFRRKP